MNDLSWRIASRRHTTYRNSNSERFQGRDGELPVGLRTSRAKSQRHVVPVLSSALNDGRAVAHGHSFRWLTIDASSVQIVKRSPSNAMNHYEDMIQYAAQEKK